MAFDRQDVPRAGAALGLSNYWGYSPLRASSRRTRSSRRKAMRAREFRDMVKALHKAGIGVILDVVF